MITTPSDYEEKLWELQSNAPTQTAILLPKDEKIFEVNLNTRKINVPKFLSVEKDHQAETVYFKFDRYYDLIDLTNMGCVIEYINAAGDSYIYPVPFYDKTTLISEGKVLIPWCIQGPATEKAGTVKFAIRFYSINEYHKLSYSLRTLVAESEVLKGQHTDDSQISERDIVLDNSLLELIEELQQAKENGLLALYWVDV